MLDMEYLYSRSRSIAWSIMRLLVTFTYSSLRESSAKTAELIEMQFSVLARVPKEPLYYVSLPHGHGNWQFWEDDVGTFPRFLAAFGLAGHSPSQESVKILPRQSILLRCGISPKFVNQLFIQGHSLITVHVLLPSSGINTTEMPQRKTAKLHNNGVISKTDQTPI